MATDPLAYGAGVDLQGDTVADDQVELPFRRHRRGHPIGLDQPQETAVEDAGRAAIEPVGAAGPMRLAQRQVIAERIDDAAEGGGSGERAAGGQRRAEEEAPDRCRLSGRRPAPSGRR